MPSLDPYFDVRIWYESSSTQSSRVRVQYEVLGAQTPHPIIEVQLKEIVTQVQRTSIYLVKQWNMWISNFFWNLNLIVLLHYFLDAPGTYASKNF